VYLAKLLTCLLSSRLQVEIDKKVQKFLEEEEELLKALKPRRKQLVEVDENDPGNLTLILRFEEKNENDNFYNDSFNTCQ
jgi:hypothetical protein